MSRLNCPQCQLVVINGTPCHEKGCPLGWIDPRTQKGYEKECERCFDLFVPESKGQRFCCESCLEDFHYDG